jgi:hypothetical protein
MGRDQGMYVRIAAEIKIRNGLSNGRYGKA